jgi:hypothetical protein
MDTTHAFRPVVAITTVMYAEDMQYTVEALTATQCLAPVAFSVKAGMLISKEIPMELLSRELQDTMKDL